MFKTIQNAHNKTDRDCKGGFIFDPTGWISQLSVAVVIICIKFAPTTPSSGANKAKDIGKLLKHYLPVTFFSQVLTKSYKMKCEPDDDDPFSFEGPEIISTSGYVYYKTD